MNIAEGQEIHQLFLGNKKIKRAFGRSNQWNDQFKSIDDTERSDLILLNVLQVRLWHGGGHYYHKQQDQAESMEYGEGRAKRQTGLRAAKQR